MIYVAPDIFQGHSPIQCTLCQRYTAQLFFEASVIFCHFLLSGFVSACLVSLSVNRDVCSVVEDLVFYTVNTMSITKMPKMGHSFRLTVLSIRLSLGCQTKMSDLCCQKSCHIRCHTRCHALRL